MARELIIPQIPTPSTADWPGFRSALRTCAEWQRIANDANAQHVAELRELMWRIGQDPMLFLELAELWVYIVGDAEPTTPEIVALNAILEENGIGMRINAVTQMLEPWFE